MRIDLARLQTAVTNRAASTFNADFSSATETMQGAVSGSVILVVGAAGSIAGATMNQLIPFKPKELILVDIDENGLTDLVRNLRNTWDDDRLPKLTPILMDITANRFRRWFETRRDVSIVLNFSAVKHVRSERDAYSLLRMFEVNVLACLRITEVVNDYAPECHLFSVSTDKAANPVNFMGASKRLMEAVLFRDANQRATSARFANVAFSQGSLLQAWLRRIELGQPMPVPLDTKRFFVSMEEAGQLCSIAAFAMPNQSIAIPDFTTEQDLQSLEEVARRVLSEFDLTPKFVLEESEAKALAYATMSDRGSQVILMTPLDTEGEKPFEEFVGDGDRIQELEYREVRGVWPEAINDSALTEFLDWLERKCSEPEENFSKSLMREAVDRVLPNTKWSIANAQLDDRV